METLPEHENFCPYCGESILLVIDCSAGGHSYVEDCQVCCRPIEVAVECADPQAPTVELRRDDE
jgi:hypothetical protein